MHTTKCPRCGHEASTETACPDCGHAAVNGVAMPGPVPPPPPPELAGLVIEQPTPEMLEEARRTFNAEEYLAAVREIEAGGGFQLEDFIDEIEQITNAGR